MSPPSVPTATWVLAAFDPMLIAVAVYLGWRANQFGKVFLAAIVALAVSVLFAWLVTAVGIPWVAPVSRTAPTLFPVRTVAAFLWAAAAYGTRRATKRA